MRPLYIYAVKPVRVVDGDSIDLEIDLGFKTWKFERVRLSSIDTPEITGSQATPEGQVAKEFTREWLNAASLVFLHSIKYDHREKYGRVLGDLYRVDHNGIDDPTPLGLALREAGHSKA